jgi:phage gp46-like protein
MSFTVVGDIKFFYTANSPSTLGPAYIAVDGVDLLRDPGFETAVLISLFTDARADDSDVLPSAGISRRGYFGSSLLGFNLGSKLWLLERSKLGDTNTLRLAEQYIRDALEWMRTDGIASSIEAVAVVSGRNQLNFSVKIKRKDVDDITFKFYANWEYQTAGGLAA